MVGITLGLKFARNHFLWKNGLKKKKKIAKNLHQCKTQAQCSSKIHYMKMATKGGGTQHTIRPKKPNKTKHPAAGGCGDQLDYQFIHCFFDYQTTTTTNHVLNLNTCISPKFTLFSYDSRGCGGGLS
eukprot:m.345851 g.345851  ORF g.345851 m.345851 type:complete len:127 (+) comp27453_c0_seq1:577-957(+)